MKRFLLLITCFTLHSAHGAQRQLRTPISRTVIAAAQSVLNRQQGTPISGAARTATEGSFGNRISIVLVAGLAVSVTHTIWAFVKALRNRNDPRQLAHVDVSEIQTQLAEQTAAPAGVELNALTEQLTQLTAQQGAVESVTPNHQDTVVQTDDIPNVDIDALQAELRVLSEQLERLTAQQHAVIAADRVHQKQLIEQQELLSQQREVIAELRTSLAAHQEASARKSKKRDCCSPRLAVLLAMGYLTLQHIVPSLITPMYPS